MEGTDTEVEICDKVQHCDSVADSWAIKKPKYNSKKEIVSAQCNLDPSSELYNMNHKRRGVAIIFNHIHFKKEAPRTGAEKDSENLAKTLMYLGFDVRVYIDPSLKMISSVLLSTAEEDHTDADCLVLVAMSHGGAGVLYTKDIVYPVDILWNAFTADRCPTLVGKPKLFFIQACRGTDMDSGVNVYNETDSVSSYSIPSHADIMVAYSTYDGYYSWRNMDTGSWFIQILCQELMAHWRTYDLLRIMTCVVRRVAIEFTSFVPHNERMHGKKQIPSIVSMLTRLVYFTEKQIEDSKPSKTQLMIN